MKGSIVTPERLREVLDYSDAGVFWCRVNRCGPTRSGAVAGYKGKDGYIKIVIDGRRYQAHRLAWLYVHGVWPESDIDHLNGDRADNRISNLRLATRSQNVANAPAPITNTSGFKGVHKHHTKWRAEIMVKGKAYRLGRFDTAEDAHLAYASAAIKHFGMFARLA